MTNLHGSKRNPFTCHICRRKTDELRFCPVCKREVCFKCIILQGAEVDYAMGNWLCKRCEHELAAREAK